MSQGPWGVGKANNDSQPIGAIDSTDEQTQVKFVGDLTNKAIRVNVVAGGSGSTTANQGTPNTVANAWPIKVTDGVDTALVTAAGALQVDGSGVTQPISAASLPLPAGAATEATLATRLADATFTGRINTQGQKTMAASTPVVIASDQSAVPVSGTVSVSGSVAVTGPLTDTQLRATPVPVSGTVDTELPAIAALADNTANPTTTSVGTFPSWFDGSTWDRARGDSADGLLVNLGANNDVTVTGTVTANAGTNLNTSLLALDSTVAKDASLTTLNTSVNTLLKPANTLTAVTTVSTVTNLAQMSGVAISLNTGVRDAGTQRVTVATNDLVPISAASLPLPAGAATLAAQTQPGVDIGDVTVNNAAGAAAVNIQDGGNSLTVDNAALSVVGGGTEATALRVTIANDSTGLLSVDDNGASLTVDSAQLPAALVGARLDTNIGAWLGSTSPTVGSKTSANSVPVVIASDQGAISVSSKIDLAPAAPTAASVGVASAQVVAANASRKGLVLINTTSLARISLGFGSAAVLDSSITLFPNGGSFEMDEYTFDLGAVNAIASSAASNLAIQEYS